MQPSEALLTLERLDLAADGLREQRATLPEIAKLEINAGALTGVGPEHDATLARRTEIEGEERRIASGAADFAERAGRVEKDLYSGRVAAAKELEALQLEMRGFKERQAALEEEQLDLMERLEAVDAELAALEARRGALEAEGAALRKARAAAEVELDDELARVASERAEVEPQLPAALLDAYGRARRAPGLGGRVTARCEGNVCGVCRNTLPVMEAKRVRREPAEVAVLCPACRRIFVRP